jgi:hypothetical protein
METKKVWIIGKRRIDGQEPGTPIELEERTANYYDQQGLVSGKGESKEAAQKNAGEKNAGEQLNEVAGDPVIDVKASPKKAKNTTNKETKE